MQVLKNKSRLRNKTNGKNHEKPHTIRRCEGPKCERHVHIHRGVEKTHCRCGHPVDRTHEKSHVYDPTHCQNTGNPTSRLKGTKVNICLHLCDKKYKEGCLCAESKVLQEHAGYLCI